MKISSGSVLLIFSSNRVDGVHAAHPLMPEQTDVKMEKVNGSATEPLQLPHGLCAMETQVAGHTFETASLGLLQDTTAGRVLKPLGKPECGLRELNFYETLWCPSASNADSLLPSLRALVPKFYRKQKLVVNLREHTFLELEDLTHGMLKPCIMDVKVGRRTWDPLATEQKRLMEEQKYVRCKQILGLCVPGFQVYPLDGGVVLRYSKEYGKQLDADGFRATIALFLNVKGDCVCKPLLHEILKQLHKIRSWFSVQTLFHFYASSLLIVYDFAVLQAQLRQLPSTSSGKLTNGNAQNDQVPCADLPTPPHWIKVKMIDFAHVFPAENRSLDTNYMFGLQNLIAVLEDLLPR